MAEGVLDLAVAVAPEHVLQRHGHLGPGRYGSEAPFAPRIGGTAEDDGYLLSFVTDETTGTSECVLLDAARIQDGPVCRIALPHKICSGTHACWADRAQLVRVS